MKPIYIRTDKNGTKIFYDFTCPRCAGAGFSDKWAETGRVCFACGGSGKRTRAKVVKEYTQEYFEKLQARQRARNKKQAEESARYAEEHQEEITAAQREIIKKRYAEFGCGPDGTGFILKGNTFQIKDQIKAAGGKWVYGAWICPVEITSDDVKAKKLSLAGHIGSGSVIWLDDFDLYAAIHKGGKEDDNP